MTDLLRRQSWRAGRQGTLRVPPFRRRDAEEHWARLAFHPRRRILQLVPIPDGAEISFRLKSTALVLSLKWGGRVVRIPTDKEGCCNGDNEECRGVCFYDPSRRDGNIAGSQSDNSSAQARSNVVFSRTALRTIPAKSMRMNRILAIPSLERKNGSRRGQVCFEAETSVIGLTGEGRVRRNAEWRADGEDVGPFNSGRLSEGRDCKPERGKVSFLCPSNVATLLSQAPYFKGPRPL
jgi:hypothetical protein